MDMDKDSEISKKNEEEEVTKKAKNELVEKNKKNLDKRINSMANEENSKVFYGDVSEVNSIRFLPYEKYLENEPKKQKMVGFDDCYGDFVDYILKITHWIWEEKGLGVIYDTYGNNIVMHTGSVNISGVKEIVAGTLQTLHSFPDRRLIGQNVVWSRLGDDGFLSSHRILSVATNLNDSSFGPATGKRVSFRTTVDCAVEKNYVYEEWLVRDNLWIVQQLGLNPLEVAKKMAKNAKSKLPALQTEFGLAESMDGQFAPKKYIAKDNTVGEFMLEALSHIYECKLFNTVKKYYESNAVVHYICDKDLVGYDQIQGMLVSLFASFPNAKYSIDRVTINDFGTYQDVAVRWYLRGLNEGIGYFGNPTGKSVVILGISHYTVKNNKIVEEWVTYDGLDVLKQIHIDCEDECECNS